MAKDKISRPYDGEKTEITKGEYGEIEKLFNEINRKVDLDILSYSIDPITKHLSIWMHYWEGITFESPQIPSILDFKGIRDETGYHIGYKESSHIHSTLTSQNLISDCWNPNDVYLLGYNPLSDCGLHQSTVAQGH